MLAVPFSWRSSCLALWRCGVDMSSKSCLFGDLGDVYYTIGEVEQARARLSDLFALDDLTGSDPQFAAAVQGLRRRSEAAEAAISAEGTSSVLDPSGPYRVNRLWGALVEAGREAAALAVRIAASRKVERPQSAIQWEAEQGSSLGLVAIVAIGLGAWWFFGSRGSREKG